MLYALLLHYYFIHIITYKEFTRVLAFKIGWHANYEQQEVSVATTI
jgi:hypothetical protein